MYFHFEIFGLYIHLQTGGVEEETEELEEDSEIEEEEEEEEEEEPASEPINAGHPIILFTPEEPDPVGFRMPPY